MKNLKFETRISTFLSAQDLTNEIKAAKQGRLIKKKKGPLQLKPDGEIETDRDPSPEQEEPSIAAERADQLRRRYIETGNSELNPLHPLSQE